MPIQGQERVDLTIMLSAVKNELRYVLQAKFSQIHLFFFAFHPLSSISLSLFDLDHFWVLLSTISLPLRSFPSLLSTILLPFGIPFDCQVRRSFGWPSWKRNHGRLFYHGLWNHSTQSLQKCFYVHVGHFTKYNWGNWLFTAGSYWNRFGSIFKKEQGTLIHRNHIHLPNLSSLEILTFFSLLFFFFSFKKS